MSIRFSLIALLLAPLLVNAGDTPAPGNKPKYGPRDVEVRLHDGSLIRGQLTDLDEISFQTPFGALKVPVTEMICLLRGKEAVSPDARQLAAAMKDLSGETATARSAAVQVLEAGGDAAVDLLFDARQKAAGDGRARIDALLKRILAKASVKEDSADTLRAAKFEGKGKLVSAGFTLKSKLGDLKLKFEDLAGVQWLGAGTVQTLELEAPIAFKEWADTGIDIGQGEMVAIAATGQVMLFNQPMGPTGTNNWSVRQFRAGTVVAKFGANGEPFAIGRGKRWTAEAGDRLYVKMFCPDDLLQRDELEQATGKFSIKIGSGSRNEEVDVPAGGD